VVWVHGSVLWAEVFLVQGGLVHHPSLGGFRAPANLLQALGILFCFVAGTAYDRGGFVGVGAASFSFPK